MAVADVYANRGFINATDSYSYGGSGSSAATTSPILTPSVPGYAHSSAQGVATPDPNGYSGWGTLSNSDLINSDPDLSTEYNFWEYLEGLFASVGAENAINRQFNSDEAAAQRDWASKENQLARDYSERMSNTAYTRAVADLKAAGLNPILAVTNGGSAASVPGSTAGSSAANSSAGGDTMSAILNSIANVASAISDFLPKKTVGNVITKVLEIVKKNK